MHFSTEDVERYNKIKRRLCVALWLAHSNFEVLCTLYINSSKIAVGAELLQREASEVKR